MSAVVTITITITVDGGAVAVRQSAGPDTPLREGAGTTDKPDGPGSVLATTSSEQEALAAGEGESCGDIRARSSVAPLEESPERVSQFSPQPDACSTEPVLKTDETAKECTPACTLAGDQIDLTPPPRLLAKRREIEERRARE